VNSNTDVAPFLRQEFIRIRPNREGDREAIVAGEDSGLVWAGWVSALRLPPSILPSSHGGTACYLVHATSPRRLLARCLPFPQSVLLTTLGSWLLWLCLGPGAPQTVHGRSARCWLTLLPAALLMRTFTDHVMLFTQTKKQAHRMHILLGLLGLQVGELHGNLSQTQRLEALR
jgi:hypothetical protein